MAWDAAKPSGSQKLRLSDEEIRANWEALEDALNREHTFPGTLGSTAGQHKIPVVGSAPTGAEGRLAIVNNILQWFSNGQWRSTFPAGTRMLFAQASAPAGWTQDTSLNDRVLRVVSGQGGGIGGSWTITGLTVQGHALTIDEMPAHSHTIPYKQANTKASGGEPILEPGTPNVVTSTVGGGQAHSHGLTADGTWRPAYLDVIVAAKD